MLIWPVMKILRLSKNYLNYQKHLKDAEEWVLPDKRQEYAWKKTQKDIYDAMQSLEYEINTLFTSNGQTPFTSLGFGLGTSRFEREIQKAILNQAPWYECLKLPFEFLVQNDRFLDRNQGK